MNHRPPPRGFAAPRTMLAGVATAVLTLLSGPASAVPFTISSTGTCAMDCGGSQSPVLTWSEMIPINELSEVTLSGATHFDYFFTGPATFKATSTSFVGLTMTSTPEANLDSTTGVFTYTAGGGPTAQSFLFSVVLSGPPPANPVLRTGVIEYSFSATTHRSFSATTFEVSGTGTPVVAPPAVPEPESWALFAAGLGALLSLRRRQRSSMGGARA